MLLNSKGIQKDANRYLGNKAQLAVKSIFMDLEFLSLTKKLNKIFY